MTDDKAEWIKLLSEQRKSCGLTVPQIESKMNIASGWIKRIESGQNCPIELIFGYARAIDIDIDKFGSVFAKSTRFYSGWHISSVDKNRSKFHFDYAGHPASVEIVSK